VLTSGAVICEAVAVVRSRGVIAMFHDTVYASMEVAVAAVQWEADDLTVLDFREVIVELYGRDRCILAGCVFMFDDRAPGEARRFRK